MALPDKATAEALFIYGQDYAIDNYGQTFLMYFPAYLDTAPQASPGGQPGDHFMFDGETALEPTNNPLANTGTPLMEKRNTGTIKMLCTFNPHITIAKFKTQSQTQIRFREEYNYIYGKGYIRDMANLLNCDYLTITIADSFVEKYKLIGNPSDQNSIAQDRYFTCWLEQVK
jgi:hypothetical protein